MKLYKLTSFIVLLAMLVGFSSPTNTYPTLKKMATDARKRFAQQYAQASTQSQKDKVIKEAADFITQHLVEKIIPEWYGTAWSFEGHTDTPKKGHIACGYFVSTTLLHTGFTLNRYKLAQQAPIHEAKSIQGNAQFITLSESSPQALKEYAQKSLQDGLYFLGLGNFHVGYLYVQKPNSFFIHSNFASSSHKVERETMPNPTVMTGCKTFYIAPITHNKELITKWILQKEMTIFKN